MSTETISLSTQGVVGAEIDLTTEKLLTLYVVQPPAQKNNFNFVIQTSPDGTTWINTDAEVSGRGQKTTEVVGVKARFKLIRTKGDNRNVTVHLLAR